MSRRWPRRTAGNQERAGARQGDVVEIPRALIDDGERELEGRRFFGVELDERYCRMARARISAWAARGPA